MELPHPLNISFFTKRGDCYASNVDIKFILTLNRFFTYKISLIFEISSASLLLNCKMIPKK